MNLKEMEELLGVFERTGDGVYAVDPEQRILFWNEGARRILGYAPEEVVGRFCYEVVRGVDEQEQPFCRRECAAVLCGRQGVKSRGQNLLIKDREGNPRWLSMTHIFVPTANNGLGALVHIFRDITGEVEAKRLVGRLAAFAARYAPEEVATTAQPEAKLTAREVDVLRLLSQGLSTRAIAERLRISQTTVRNHIQGILSKLGVHTRLEAVVLASRHKLV